MKDEKEKALEDEEREKALEDFFEVMRKGGNKGGEEIAAIASKLHPDALFIAPLYRSCMVVLPKTEAEEERGAITIKLYHDPSWIGGERTVENLPKFYQNLKLWGQRSHVDMTLDDETLDTEDGWRITQEVDEMMKARGEKDSEESE